MTGAGKDTLVKGKRSCTVLFFSAYFIYYAAYCVFSSFSVLFLTEQSYSATVCGIITSLTFLANLLMEPVGGYITDTFLPTRRYLLVCIGIVSMMCTFCTKFMDQSWLLLPGLVLAAGLAYPFSQLMDAWVNLSKESYPGLIYSRIRAGGSIGFAVMSVILFQTLGMESLFSGADSFVPYDDSVSSPSSRYQAWKSPEERGGREKPFVCSGVSTIGKKPSISVLFNNKHSLLVQSSAGWQLPVTDYCGAWRRCGIIWKCLRNRSSRRVFESAFAGPYWKKENLSGPLGDGSSFGHKPAASDLLSVFFG